MRIDSRSKEYCELEAPARSRQEDNAVVSALQSPFVNDLITALRQAKKIQNFVSFRVNYYGSRASIWLSMAKCPRSPIHFLFGKALQPHN